MYDWYMCFLYLLIVETASHLLDNISKFTQKIVIFLIIELNEGYMLFWYSSVNNTLHCTMVFSYVRFKNDHFN